MTHAHADMTNIVIQIMDVFSLTITSLMHMENSSVYDYTNLRGIY
jgi:hypothetical protein